MLNKSTLNARLVSVKKTLALLAVTIAITLNAGCTVTTSDLELLGEWVTVLTEMYDSVNTPTADVQE